MVPINPTGSWPIVQVPIGLVLLSDIVWTPRSDAEMIIFIYRSVTANIGKQINKNTSQMTNRNENNCAVIREVTVA